MDSSEYTLESGDFRFTLKVELPPGMSSIRLTYMCNQIYTAASVIDEYFSELTAYPILSKPVRSWWWERIWGVDLHKKTTKIAQSMKKELIEMLQKEGRAVTEVGNSNHRPLITLPPSDIIH